MEIRELQREVIRPETQEGSESSSDDEKKKASVPSIRPRSSAWIFALALVCGITLFVVTVGFVITSLVEDVDSNHVAVLQRGDAYEVKHYGYHYQGFAKVTTYEYITGVTVREEITFPDGERGEIDVWVRYSLPASDRQLIRLHRNPNLGSQERLERVLIKPAIRAAFPRFLGAVRTLYDEWHEPVSDSRLGQLAEVAIERRLRPELYRYRVKVEQITVSVYKP